MSAESQLSDGERSVLLLHPHWKTVLRPALLLVVVVVIAAALLVVIPPGRLAGPGRIAVGVVAIAAAVAVFAVPFLRWQTTTYELTTRRLRLRSGILSRSGRDFPLIRISDVSFSHGPDRPDARLRPAGGGVRGRARPARAHRDPATCERSRPRCSSWSRTSSSG